MRLFENWGGFTGFDGGIGFEDRAFVGFVNDLCTGFEDFINKGESLGGTDFTGFNNGLNFRGPGRLENCRGLKAPPNGADWRTLKVTPLLKGDEEGFVPLGSCGLEGCIDFDTGFALLDWENGCNEIGRRPVCFSSGAWNALEHGFGALKPLGAQGFGTWGALGTHGFGVLKVLGLNALEELKVFGALGCGFGA